MRFRVDGVTELIDALKQMPERLGAQAQVIVPAHAHRAADQIVAAYTAHRRSGRMADTVKVIEQRSRYGVSVQVRAASPEAHLFEFGTQARHSNLRATGAMPAANIFVPIAQRERRGMYGDLKELLTSEGFTVRGDV
jgi:hypothetical protein